MLATFIIGLREGLEAALIVSIVATFLRRNGRPLRPMWIGVAAAVTLSILVGVVLSLVEQSLPHSAQEGMESIINAVAVLLVTSMILWMAKHARGMKRELESAASAALASGTSRALVLMAFLAVLKEGFETAVFLLATFSAASSAWYAAAGAVLGILVAVGLGYGLYTGGVRLNLARFFKYTSVFLVLVAAGLLVSALRTAHEAGWLNAGQQRTLDLAWLAPTGSVRGAVLTGVLGIPADPRLIEVLAWVAYVVPMLLVIFWPQSRRPGVRAARTIKLAVAGSCALAALVLVIAVRPPTLAAPGAAPLIDATGAPAGTASLSATTLRTVIDGRTANTALGQVGRTDHAGVSDTVLLAGPRTDGGGSSTVTLAELVELNGGRLPAGVAAERNPGPFTLTRSSVGGLRVWSSHDRLLDATDDERVIATLTGGGLATPRTITLSGAQWSVDQTYVQQTAGALAGYTAQRAERRFWRWVIPGVLLTAAVALVLAARRTRPESVLPADRTAKVPAGSPSA